MAKGCIIGYCKTHQNRVYFSPNLIKVIFQALREERDSLRRFFFCLKGKLMVLATIALIPLTILLGVWALPRLFPPKPIVLSPINDQGRIMIEKTIVKIKPLQVRIWESDIVQAIRLILALIGLLTIAGWFIG